VVVGGTGESETIPDELVEDGSPDEMAL